MTESQPASATEVAARLPTRHGAPWENEEFHQLVEWIQQGLTLAQLADRHQRTPGAICGAAMRLIPPALRPDSRASSVDILARYLGETEGLDRQSLIYAECPAPATRKAVEQAPDLAARSTHTGQRTRSSETGSKEVNYAQAWDTEKEFAANTKSRVDATTCADASDVVMLVSVAVASLPKERDRDVLGTRLGVDGQPLTLAEIGAAWGVSRERVRQIQEGAFRRLAARARKEGTPGAVLKKLLEPACVSPGALATWLLDAARSGFEIPPGLAAKFILRAAGFAKAKAAEVAALQPAIERSRKARLSKLARSRAAAERVESVINRWLKCSDWPDAAAPPPAAVQLSAQRLVNDSDIAGSFHSHKLDRVVHYESGLELEIFTLLERSERIAYYQEQPALIPYIFKGRRRIYCPDLLVATADGRGLVIEVKPTERMALSISRARADAGRAWAHAHGWGWLVVSDRHTLRQVEEHVISASTWMLLDNELRTHGVLTWRNMLSFRTRHGLTKFDFTAYIIQSGAEFDRAYRITARNVSTHSRDAGPPPSRHGKEKSALGGG